MNQAVVQMYLLILVGVLGVALALRPRLPGRAGHRAVGFVRFFLVAGVGTVLVVRGFHAPGRVDALRVDADRAWVLEAHPGRLWSESVWTALELEGGRVHSGSPPPSAEAAATATVADPVQVPRTLRGRIVRRSRSGERLPVGPELEQPVLAFAGIDFAVVSAFDTVYEPETLYVARYADDGSLVWRRDGGDVGVTEGRLRRAGLLPGGDLLLVFEGVSIDRSWLERLTLDTHLVAARLDPATGEVRWTERF